MLIAYGAGHGKYTAGKRSPSGKFEEREWVFNDEVARAFANDIKNYDVKLMRTDDPTGETDVPLSTRTNKANSAKADFYISFHHNAYQSKWGNHGGVETFYHAQSSKGKAIARIVQDAIVKAYGLTDRGIKTANLHITRETAMPSVLVEGGFMDSNIDIKKLRDKKVLQNAGKEIAQAILKHFKLKRTGSKPSTNTNASKPKPKPQKPPKQTNKAELTVDGKIGKSTVRELQKALGTIQDGIISKQYRNSVTTQFYGTTIQFGSGGSVVIRSLQKKVGVKQDGLLGPATIRALQKHLG